MIWFVEVERFRGGGVEGTVIGGSDSERGRFENL